MTRILFWLALAFLVLMAIRSKLKGVLRPPPQSGQGPRPAPGRAQQLPDPESMLCCAHCGVYYPASETVQARGRDYCSHAHATLP
ncbi:PP0621 family protein [Janthinobacterium agaricidamnosum]|uniref:Uncharacterized protein n=1 Tax=Janthinobacterium agaricidamnosum NBRC 102515 = DSM 9628 TaxID=1349767 RepID=W0V229_9BURK|nr:PP0621 family protein [Janthinobacterium agaricidamnosum]CDG81388.1 putative uncharacterized protein [Janthinobacterium agaricidamnosum NBRC 102515 = DSM 9628]